MRHIREKYCDKKCRKNLYVNCTLEIETNTGNILINTSFITAVSHKTRRSYAFIKIVLITD